MRDTRVKKSFKMFKTAAFCRKGEPYGAASANLVGKTKVTHTTLQGAVRNLQFREYWEDKLDSSQARDFVPVPTIAAWEKGKLSKQAAADVEAVPVISASMLLSREGKPERFSFVTYAGRGGDFYLPSMEGAEEGKIPLPQMILEWLEDDNVAVIGSGFLDSLNQAEVGHRLEKYTDTRDIFAYFISVGLVKYHGKGSPPVDLAAQLAFCTGYHHAPASKQHLCDLIGACNYKGPLPAHRHPEYRVPTGRSLSDGAHFNRYYEVAGPFCLIYRIVEHGLLFGGVTGVQNGQEFGPTLLHFLGQSVFRSGVAHEGELPQEEALFPVAMEQGGELAQAEVASSSSVVEVPPQGEGRPAKEEQESVEVLDLADEGLEQEMAEEDSAKGKPGPSAASANNNNDPVPSTSKQYYTSGFLRQVKIIDGKSNILPIPFPGKKKEECKSKDGTNPPPAPPPNQEGSPGKRRRIEVSKPDRPPPPRSPPRSRRSPPRGGPQTSRRSAPPKWYRDHNRARDGPRRSFPPVDWKKNVRQDSGVVHHQDLRSRLQPNLPYSHGTLAKEATAAAALRNRPSFTPSVDESIALSRRVEVTVRSKGFVAGHRHLPVTESDLSVAHREKAPLDETRLGQQHLTRVDRYENRFVSNPIYESRCDFCGSKRCSRVLRGTATPNCARYSEQIRLAPTRRLCNYRRCPHPATHHTHVCPALIQRCPRCQCRGHGAADLCDSSNAEIMDRLRADFEEVADASSLTGSRQQQLCWGFYPYPRGAPIDFCPISYDALTEMPVLEALNFLAALLAQPENQGHYPDYLPGGMEPPSDYGSRRDGGGPPPPPPGAGAAGVAV